MHQDETTSEEDHEDFRNFVIPRVMAVMGFLLVALDS